LLFGHGNHGMEECLWYVIMQYYWSFRVCFQNVGKKYVQHVTILKIK